MRASGEAGDRVRDPGAGMAATTSGAPSSGRGVHAPDLLVHAGSLYRLARHLGASRTEAEDLTQETYLRAVRALERETPCGDVRAWIHRIMRNAWLDGSRWETRHPASGLQDDGEGAGADADGAPLRGDAELERLRGIVSEEIQSALQALPLAARETVLLDLEGFTETEVAEIAGCAVGTVKSRLARARRALRERLADYRRPD